MRNRRRFTDQHPRAFGADSPIPDAHEMIWQQMLSEIEHEDGARVEVKLHRSVPGQVASKHLSFNGRR